MILLERCWHRPNQSLGCYLWPSSLIILLFAHGNRRCTKQGVGVCAERPPCAGRPGLTTFGWKRLVNQSSAGASCPCQDTKHFPIPGPRLTHSSACFPAFPDHFAHGSFQKIIQWWKTGSLPVVTATPLHKDSMHPTVLSKEHTSHAWGPDYNGLINPPRAHMHFSQCTFT